MTADADTLLSMEGKWSRVSFPFRTALRTLLHSLPGQVCSHPFCSSMSLPYSQQTACSRCQPPEQGAAKEHCQVTFSAMHTGGTASRMPKEGVGWRALGSPGTAHALQSSSVWGRVGSQPHRAPPSTRQHFSLFTLALTSNNKHPPQTQQVSFSATAKSYQDSIIYLQYVKEGKSISQGHIFGI